MAQSTEQAPGPGATTYEVLSLRLHPRDLLVLTEAAALQRVTVAEFIALAAYQQAKQVLADRRPASGGSPSAA